MDDFGTRSIKKPNRAYTTGTYFVLFRVADIGSSVREV